MTSVMYHADEVDVNLLTESCLSALSNIYSNYILSTIILFDPEENIFRMTFLFRTEIPL